MSEIPHSPVQMNHHAAALDDVARGSSVLDNPVWSALAGVDRRLSEGGEKARRYRPSVSPFSAVSDENDPGVWEELADLAVGEPVWIMASRAPAGWIEEQTVPLVQMIYAEVPEGHLPCAREFTPLEPADVPDMLALVEQTKPGPFAPSTIELGGYRGWWVDGELACMGGERMHPGNWTEISGVCTAPTRRGQGLAGEIVMSLVKDIQAAGRRPFLHVAAANSGARRLYEKLGFRERASLTVRALREHGSGCFEPGGG